MRGWLFGMLEGRSGLFPKEFVVPAPGPQTIRQLKAKNRVNIESRLLVEGLQPRSDPLPPVPAPSEEQKRYTMQEFAKKYFRDSSDKYILQRKSDGSIRGSLKFMGTLKRSILKKGDKKKTGEGSGMSVQQSIEAVSYTNSPIQASLIELPSAELNKLSIECFLALMQIMGDYPLRPRLDAGQEIAVYECVTFIIKTCVSHPQLRDEVLCQVIKQITDNRSAKRTSCQQGWRLLFLVCAFLPGSQVLRPYIFHYLIDAASHESQSPYGPLAGKCLENQRVALKCGGRHVIPSETEVTHVLEGRVAKRQQFLLPGGIRTMLKVTASTVAMDITTSVCSTMGIVQEADRQEYGLFAIIGNKQNETLLHATDYIMDISTHLEQMGIGYVLLFRRVLWKRPIHSENDNLTLIVYNQVRQDYIRGNMVILENGEVTADQLNTIIQLAALQMRANDQVQIATQKDLNVVLPFTLKEKQQSQKWLYLLHHAADEARVLTPSQARARFVGILEKWKLFGCSFFEVKVRTGTNSAEDRLLAVNRNGFFVLKHPSHEILQYTSLSEIVSTRHLKTNDGHWYFDVKHGDLMRQRVSRFETKQGVEISEMIARYIKHQEQETQQELHPVPSDYESNAFTKLWPSAGQQPGPGELALPTGQSQGDERYRLPPPGEAGMSPDEGNLIPVSPKPYDSSPSNREKSYEPVVDGGQPPVGLINGGMDSSSPRPHRMSRSIHPPPGGIRVMALPSLNVNTDSNPEQNNVKAPRNLEPHDLDGSRPQEVKPPPSSPLPVDNGYLSSPPALPAGQSLSTESVVRNPRRVPSSRNKQKPQATDNILKRGMNRGKRK